MASFSCITLILFVVLIISDAKVDFTYSSMYSIFDFEGVAEVPLPRCDNGCLIFASTMPNNQPSEDGLEPFMKNLVIYDAANDQNHSIAEIGAYMNLETSKKIPLDIAGPGTYFILNLNALEDKGTDVNVWVIERAKANDIDYEIYDAGNMNRAVTTPRSVITIMSPMQFRVIAEPGEDKISYTTRLVGFDNALENNPDKCRYAYKTNDNTKFEGFEFQINAPIFSIAFNEKQKVHLKADFAYVNVRDLGQSGFLSSPGYNGCDGLGGDQVHRAKWTHYSDEYDLHGEPDSFSVYFDGDLDTAEGRQIDIKDMTNSQTFPISGPRAKITMTIPSTQYLIIRYTDITAPQSFLLRYTSTLIQKATSADPKTTSETVPSTTPSISTTTTGGITTSTTGSKQAIISVLLLMLLLQLCL